MHDIILHRSHVYRRSPPSSPLQGDDVAAGGAHRNLPDARRIVCTVKAESALLSTLLHGIVSADHPRRRVIAGIEALGLSGDVGAA